MPPDRFLAGINPETTPGRVDDVSPAAAVVRHQLPFVRSDRDDDEFDDLVRLIHCNAVEGRVTERNTSLSRWPCPAAALRSALLSLREAPFGVRIRSAEITGQLDLDGVILTFPLEFVGCYFQGVLGLEGARLTRLVVRGPTPSALAAASGGSRLAGLRGAGLRLDGDLDLSGTTVNGAIKTDASTSRTAAVWLNEATIGGQFRCTSTSFVVEGDRALHADRLTVGGNIRFVGDFSSNACIRMIGANIGGSLDLTGALIDPPDGRALELDEVTIGGSVFVIDRDDRRPRLTGSLELKRADIRGDLFFRGADLQPRVAQVAYYDPEYEAGPLALRATGAEIGGAVRIEGESLVLGAVLLDSTTIHGGLKVSHGCRLRAMGGELALGLDEATLGSGLTLGDGNAEEGSCAADQEIIVGTIRLWRAKISGSVILSGTFRAAPGAKYLLSGAGLTLDGDLWAKGCWFLAGKLNLRNADINGIVDLAGTTIINHKAVTLNLHQARIAGNVRLIDGFRSEGIVVLNRATIGGRLRCDGGHFLWHAPNSKLDDSANTIENPHGVCVEAISATVKSGVDLGWEVDAGVDFTDLTTSFLADRPMADWPHPSRLDGFTYQRFAGLERHDPTPNYGFKARAAWLERVAATDPQPWEQAAKVLREHGDPRGAEHIMMSWESLSRERRGAAALLWSRVQSFLTGYGYRPQRILRALGALALAAYAVLWIGGQLGSTAVALGSAGGSPVSSASAFLATCSPSGQPCYNAFLYAIESVVPLIGLGQRSAWGIHDAGGVLPLLLGALTILGWAVSTIAVATVASLDRRQR